MEKGHRRRALEGGHGGGRKDVSQRRKDHSSCMGTLRLVGTTALTVHSSGKQLD